MPTANHTSAASPLTRWRRVRARLDAGQPIDQADATWLAQAAAAVIDEGQPARVAYGLAPRGGAGGLHRVARLERRDALLRSMHRTYFAEMDPRGAARAIVALLDRCSRARSLPNDDQTRAAAELLTFGPMPAERQAARILGHSNPPLNVPGGVVLDGR